MVYFHIVIFNPFWQFIYPKPKLGVMAVTRFFLWKSKNVWVNILTKEG